MRDDSRLAPPVLDLFFELRGVGLDCDEAWGWVHRPASELDGEVPAVVAASDEPRALAAAKRRAAALTDRAGVRRG